MDVPFQHWGATPSEIDGSMPGDDLIVDPASVGTRSITIAADAEDVFDFVAQMGFGKAGWYSYDLIDNLGRTSARHVEPNWLVGAPGDEVPGGPIAFTAVVVDRPRAFVLQVPHRSAAGHKIDFTLAYQLRAIPIGTRLVSRVRIRITGPLGRALETSLLAGDGVMVRKQLLGIKERAESMRVGEREDCSVPPR